MSAPTPPSPPRVVSIDAYRGLVMFLMMAEVLHLGKIAKALPDNPLWQFLAYHQSHVEWQGCSLHDLIQPSFSFLVGVALPFSLASRIARGQRFGWMTLHAAWRALLLISLGIFLRSIGKPQTNFTFEDTLTQIGLGYLPLFLLGVVRPVWQWLALVVILTGYWIAFVLYPLPGDFNYPGVGVPSEWPHHLTGFAAHWDKNSNLAWYFDTGFLNLFPRAKEFLFNGGGYATLSFIPTLGTMILGLIAGGWLKEQVGGPWHKVGRLAMAGVVCLALGWTADYLGVCPSVKRIWTPSWVLLSGGWCFLILAGFFASLDAIGHSAWAFPLRVIGANSIVAYCMAHLIDDFIIKSFQTHLGPSVFQFLGKEYEPLVSGLAVLLVYWLILFWLFRQRIFIRI